jgi:hypothetical protein
MYKYFQGTTDVELCRHSERQKPEYRRRVAEWKAVCCHGRREYRRRKLKNKFKIILNVASINDVTWDENIREQNFPASLEAEEKKPFYYLWQLFDPSCLSCYRLRCLFSVSKQKRGSRYQNKKENSSDTETPVLSISKTLTPVWRYRDPNYD